MAEPLTPSERAPGLLLGAGVELPDDVVIGGHVVIHAGTRIGTGAVIQDGAVVGKPLALGAHSMASPEAPAPAVIGAGTKVCAGAVVVAGATVGERAVIADQAHVRERSVIGDESVVGRGSAVDNDVSIGVRVRIQTNCYITAFSVIEDDVFVAPGVTLTNDDAMGRHGPDFQLTGATLRRACRVGGGVVLVPGVEIGAEAFIAAGAVVTKDVPPRAVVMGVPGRVVREVGDGRTVTLAAFAATAVGAVAVVEFGRVWRRGRAPLPAETDSAVLAAIDAASETAEVAVTGYREVSTRENAMFNLLTSFVAGFVLARSIALGLRTRNSVGPFRNVQFGRRHIHHFVPGIALAFASGAAAIVTRNEDLESLLAIPFGVGMGLTLDESALLLELDDVYWSEEGIVGVQISLAVTAMLASIALATRFLRRGEEVVLEAPQA